MYGTLAYLSFFLTCSLARSVGDVHQHAARTTTQYAQKQPPLDTPWTEDVGTNPWPEYPRPQMARSQWQNLNGIWQYQSVSSLNDSQYPPFGQDLAQEVLIPSCLESGLSGKYILPLKAAAVLIPDRHSSNKHALFLVQDQLHSSEFLGWREHSPQLRSCRL